jgi:ABC-type uncharacterized transport system ATPase subunit
VAHIPEDRGRDGLINYMSVAENYILDTYHREPYSRRGVLDLKSILQATLDIDYSYLFSFEYEKDENDPVPGLAESIGYTRGLLAGMST